MAAKLICVCMFGACLLARPALADEPLTVSKATGPSATAFDDRCAELRIRDPRATCTRIQHVVAGRLVYELFKTSLTDKANPDRSGDALWLAIGTEVGWFTASEPFDLRLDGGNGTGSVRSSATLDTTSVRPVTLAGRPSALLEVRRTWTVDCIECAPRGKTTYREIAVVACRVGPVGVGCAGLDARGAAPTLNVRDGALVVTGQLDEKSFAKRRYSIAPN